MDGSSKTEAAPLDTDDRFEFGRNWANFLSTLNETRIEAAQRSVVNLLNITDLTSKRFLDAGSGSGLFSLCAHRLGANVTSFDYDQNSVACTRELKKRYANESDQWNVLQGSLLDSSFLETLGQFDVVYCWGVAHHTGHMWKALDNLTTAVSPNGQLVVAIYNDQQYITRGWGVIKRIYQRLPSFLQPLYVMMIWAYGFLKRAAVTLAASLLRLVTLRNPFTPFVNWIKQNQDRGMHVWYDLVDWVGGWPFEVARPEEIFRFMRDRGFVMEEMTTLIGHGCNEFVFRRNKSDDNRNSEANSNG